MDGAIIQQGRFTSTGATKILSIRSDVDWIRVWNMNNINQDVADLGVEYYFQRGMAAGTGIITTKLGNTQAQNCVTMSLLAAPAGFTLINTSEDPLGAPVAVTATSNAVRPVVTVASTVGLAAGDIVRLYGITGATDLSGYDFAIDTINANDFRIASALQQAPGAAGTAGFYRKVKYGPMFYPPVRYIVNITQAASAVVTLSVPSGYKVGQEITFVIPAEFGMVQLNGLTGTITAVNDTLATQTITVNIDTTAFSAFVFPTAATAAAGAYSKAITVPAGMDTAEALRQLQDILSDATRNTGYIGVALAGGANSPGGDANNVLYWVAGKSFSVDNS